jgi:hypothetical protein
LKGAGDRSQVAGRREPAEESKPADTEKISEFERKLDAFIPPRKTTGLYSEEMRPWESPSTFVSDAVYEFLSQSQKSQSLDIPRIGDDPIITALRKRTGIRDRKTLNRIRMKLLYVFPEKSEKDLIGIIK